MKQVEDNKPSLVNLYCILMQKIEDNIMIIQQNIKLQRLIWPGDN